ncbi:MAG: coenzyme F420-0:L-glutamate ligase [Gammaproteobacteria bacterium]
MTLTALPGIPLVEPGDDLPALLLRALDTAGLTLAERDVIVVAQKIVSKAEGRYVDLASVRPSPRALELAPQVDKDPRLVEVVLSESRAVLASPPRANVVEQRLGFVAANAGVDRSNIEPGPAGERVLLLPLDPDASAARIRAALQAHAGAGIAVLVIDSIGRAWRQGTCGIAIGACGLPALLDLRGKPDLFGRRLEVTQVGFADEIAAAASVLMGQADEATPAVLVRGLQWSAPETTAAALQRRVDEDLFRRGVGAQ